jgi:hypothetical protein
VYNSTVVKKYDNNIAAPQAVYIAPKAITIVDILFGANYSEVFVVVKNSYLSNYSLLQIENNKLSKNVSIPVSTAFPFCKSIYNSTRVYLLFSSALLAYNSGNIKIVKSIVFAINNSRTSMSLLLSYIAYSYSNKAYIIDSNFSQIYSYTAAN